MSEPEPEELFLLFSPIQQAELINNRNDGPVSEEIYQIAVNAGSRGWRWSGDPASCHMSDGMRQWLRLKFAVTPIEWVTSLTEDEKAAFVAADESGVFSAELRAKLDAAGVPHVNAGWLPERNERAYDAATTVLFRPYAAFLRFAVGKDPGDQ